MKLRQMLDPVVPSVRVGCLTLLLGLALLPHVSAQTTFTVTTTDDLDDGTCDAGHCSLREAITAANNAVDGGIIAFSIPGVGPHAIQPTSPLPAIEEDIVLDGTTEPDFAGTPVIELDGTLAGLANGLDIVLSNNTIRGLVINRFAWDGIHMHTDAAHNLIEGCFIGTDVTGTLDLGNGNTGVGIGEAQNNTVGGTTAAARNLISGNPQGVTIGGLTATGNVVIGNYIGTDITGTAAIPNGTGILLLSPDNRVGGLTPEARNVISGNEFNGIYLGPPDATGNVILGNYLGVDATGSMALGNDVGVYVDNVADNVIGGASAGARNVISGSREGVTLWDVGATGNLIQGNYIGTNASGDAAIPNQMGIPVYSPGNTIGGTAAGAGNLISGNQSNGVNFYGEHASGNTVQGNLIGTDAAGTSALGNGEQGVAMVDAAGNTIGGTAAGAGNVISGNMVDGVFLLGETTQNNVVQGNLIGTDATGTTALGNGDSGVAIHSARNNTVGGTEAGARNILSGNAYGVLIGNLLATGNRIQGNYIGTNATGDAAIPNTEIGVLFWGEDNTIGGSDSGAGNVISGNTFAGIGFGEGSSGTVVQGNLIGTDATGMTALGNELGIFVTSSPDNTIGGTTAGARNVISGNTGDALSVNGLTATGNVIQGNYIGTDVTGMVAVGNGAGLTVFDAPGNTIGGTQSGAGNVISGNAGNGLSVTGVSATGNIIQGNYIGTDATGTAAVGNGGAFWITDASGNTIGGTQSGAGNLISGNGGGIRIDGLNASGNIIQGNTIGTDVTGTAPLGNGGAAVRYSNGASGNTLGGTEPGAGNIIANGGWHGVTLLETAGTGNLIRSNSIFDNGALGIDLARGGVTANDDGDVDTGPNGLQNYPALTSVSSNGGVAFKAALNSAPSSSFTLEFFSNATCDPAGNGEGETPLGRATLTTDGSGNGTVATAFSNVTGTVFTATATDANGNTSEFSECGDVTTLGVYPSPTTRTVTAGQPATFTIGVTAEGGTFEETVTLSCSGAPTGATCTFTADEVTLASGLASTTMTVATVAPAGALPGVPRGVPHLPGPLPWVLLLALPGVWVLLNRPSFEDIVARAHGRRAGILAGGRTFAVLRMAALVTVGAVLISLQASCGDGGTTPPSGGTAPGTYQITVTAAWESVQQTGNVTLVVQ